MNALPNFDRLARPYRWMEWLSFGPLLHRTRTSLLSEVQQARNALILGDGDGRFTHDLLQSNPGLHAHAVDLSPAMLRELTRRCSAFQPRLHTTHSDALTFSPGRGYDLVATHFFLDCLSQQQVQQLAGRLLPSLEKEALWLISDFDIPQQGAVRPFASVLVRSLYAAFRVLTGLRTDHLPDYASVLQQAGFVRLERRERLAGILISELWQRMSRPPASSLASF